jgi:hypothetical protein
MSISKPKYTMPRMSIASPSVECLQNSKDYTPYKHFILTLPAIKIIYGVHYFKHKEWSYSYIPTPMPVRQTLPISATTYTPLSQTTKTLPSTLCKFPPGIQQMTLRQTSMIHKGIQVTSPLKHNYAPWYSNDNYTFQKNQTLPQAIIKLHLKSTDVRMTITFYYSIHISAYLTLLVPTTNLIPLLFTWSYDN